MSLAPRSKLRESTIGAHHHNIAGSLEPGKYADLVLLDRDPTKVNPTDIEKIKVSETWLAGERRYVG
jgi:predicted amidohydrolase YtcJ